MGRWRDSYDDFEWNYYRADQPISVKDGIKAKSERGEIGSTWWSKRWIKTLESFSMGTRLTRGRSYARRGQVVSIDIEPGIVKAKVQGSMPKPYNVKIKLKPLSDANWEKVTGAMASQALFAAKLLAGEMPSNIEEAFHAVHLSLFPTAISDLETDCSCPDWANPCKHIAAVYYLLAERFDEDPFLIFKLRGRTKEQIIATLRAKRIETLPPESVTSSTKDAAIVSDNSPLLEDSLDTFWQAGEGLAVFAVNPTAPGIDKAILKRLGEAPFSIDERNITAILAKAYDMVDASFSTDAPTWLVSDRSSS
ncbi:MAG TPA: SWIM zinc finger family protein [Ktedonobacteraceae bacterium]|nr:SWIM zinc finger family protein [Ktedonobacteraceae bacterium]